MSFVNLFIANNFLEYVYDQTNLYASQVISAAPCPFTKHSQFQTWTAIIVSELKFMFVTGITNKPSLKPSWSKDPIFETPVFSKTMTQNHFESILSFLHFSDSSRYDTSTERLYKIRPVFERPSDKYIHWYISPSRLALDDEILA
jgi:hypothetical protein